MVHLLAEAHFGVSRFETIAVIRHGVGDRQRQVLRRLPVLHQRASQRTVALGPHAPRHQQAGYAEPGNTNNFRCQQSSPLVQNHHTTALR